MIDFAPLIHSGCFLTDSAEPLRLPSFHHVDASGRIPSDESDGNVAARNPPLQRANRPNENPRPARGLADLNLTDDEFQAVVQCGFVSPEWRGTMGPYYKLRFRHAGRQRVRYLGCNPSTAARIARELAERRRPKQAYRELQRAVAQARATLRRQREALSPLLAAKGLYFHGFAVRRRRKVIRPSGDLASCPPLDGGQPNASFVPPTSI